MILEQISLFHDQPPRKNVVGGGDGQGRGEGGDELALDQHSDAYPTPHSATMGSPD